jgi:murein DD-endopeptidase MepM/ murein hydrolase activator NlpD
MSGSRGFLSMMFRKKFYIVFISRDDDGQLRKIPLPLRYAYGFLLAAIIGAFTIVGLAGSYTRMLLKTENYNQVRAERETLRQNYQRMAEVAHDRSVQVASLGALANEVSALYGLRQNKLNSAKPSVPVKAAEASAPISAALTPTDDATDMSQQQVASTIDTFYALRDEALSGRVSRALEGGLTSGFIGDWTELADAPSLWPVQGTVASSFGERQDPINGEGAFHSGIDIDAPYGTPIRAAGDGIVVQAAMVGGYGREIEVDHGHDVKTLYGHLSAIAVVSGQHVTRGQVIGYVGQSGRATGPHLHYEVRVHNVPVNPHKYLRVSFQEASNLDAGSASGQ